MTTPFAAGQVLTVFRSRLRGEPDASYEALDASLRERAAALGGLVDVTSFVASDGERVTIVTFDGAESHARWAGDSAHRRAQDLGRHALYAAYSVQVAEVRHVSTFAFRDGAGAGTGA